MDIFERYMDSSVKYEPRREGDGNILLSYITQLMYPWKRWCWLGGGGCFDPLSVCMCNNGIIWYHSSLIMKIKM